MMKFLKNQAKIRGNPYTPLRRASKAGVLIKIDLGSGQLLGNEILHALPR